MKNIKNIFYVGVLMLSALCISACSDEESYDFPGDPQNRVFMPNNSTAYKIVQTPISSISNLDFEISLKCTQRAKQNIKATVEVDNSMIAAYNKEHGTSYEAIPPSALVIENTDMSILAGEMSSMDTLRLFTTNKEEIISTLRSKNGYLIPLRLAKAEGGDAQPSSNFNYTYLTVTVTEDNVNHDATSDDISGTLVADQSGWTVTTNGEVQSNYSPIECLFDADMSNTCYISGDKDLNVDFNMGKPYTFSALALYYGYSYGSWGTFEYGSLSNGMSIYISNDGQTWQSVGEITGETSKFCVFYAPLTAQYVRLVKPANSYGNVDLQAGIFNVYEK